LSDEASAVSDSVIPIRGVPVLPMPPHVLDAVRASALEVQRPRRTRGSLELRAAVADHLDATLGIGVDPDTELLISHGANHGMSVALRALVGTGDEVLVPAPTYFFDGMVRMAGALPVYVQTTSADGWDIDIAEMERLVTERTRGIVLCNPNNPTGTVYSSERLREVVAFAERHGLIVFSDESYERYCHSGRAYTPIRSFRSASDRLVTITSFSKNYAFSGWRVGYINADPQILERIHWAFEWDAINVGEVPQAAALAALTGPQEWLDREFSQLAVKRDVLLSELRTRNVPVHTPDAGIFAFADFSATGLSGPPLQEALLRHGVVALHGAGFYGPGSYARLLYGGDIDQVRRLAAAAGDLCASTR
jgi:aminotransferase